MLSFYGGPAGKDFSIAKVFNNKKELDADLALGLKSEVQPDDFVLISYGDPNSGTDFSDNLKVDGNTSYNATLWQKEYKNGVKYNLITSLISTYPTLVAGTVDSSLAFGSTPQLSIDNSSLATPKVGLKMPASLKAGNNNTTEMLAADQTPSITPVYDGTLGNELSFAAKVPKGTTFTPSVSAAGVISWTNDGGQTNPASVNIKGNKGDQGTSITGIEYTASSESGGENKFKIKYSNGTVGTEEYTIKNGIDIVNLEETRSDLDAGENIIYLIKSDGTRIGPCVLKNGSKGNTGTIKSVSATVSNTVGIPAVKATLSGDTSNADIKFDFTNIKGDKGVPGTITIKEITVDTGSIESGNPYCTVTSLTTEPENAIYSLAFHNLVGKQGIQGIRGYYLYPNVDDNGNISWTQKDGNVSIPAATNIRGPQGKTGNPLNIIANVVVTPTEVAEDTLAAVSAYLETLQQIPASGELIAVTYQKAENESYAYWYFQINNVWNRIQITGGAGSSIVQEKIEDTDATVTEKVYSAAYVNNLEKRIAALEQQLTIGKISEIKAGE